MKESITGKKAARTGASRPPLLLAHARAGLSCTSRIRHGTQPSLPANTASHSACVCDSAHPLVTVLLCLPTLLVSRPKGAGPFHLHSGWRMPPICLPLAGSTCSLQPITCSPLLCVLWNLLSVFSWGDHKTFQGNLYPDALCPQAFFLRTWRTRELTAGSIWAGVLQLLHTHTECLLPPPRKAATSCIHKRSHLHVAPWEEQTLPICLTKAHAAFLLEGRAGEHHVISKFSFQPNGQRVWANCQLRCHWT